MLILPESFSCDSCGLASALDIGSSSTANRSNAAFPARRFRGYAIQLYSPYLVPSQGRVSFTRRPVGAGATAVDVGSSGNVEGMTGTSVALVETGFAGDVRVAGAAFTGDVDRRVADGAAESGGIVAD
jgi:hypothetical protein